MTSDNIKIFINGTWYPARDYQKRAFQDINPFNSTVSYNLNDIKFRIEREDSPIYGGLYIIREDGSKSPIANFSNDTVKVFLLDKKPADWYNSRKYQQWAYYHFIYSGQDRITYMSARSQRQNDMITIDIPDLEPGIIFSMSKNEKGNIYYEKNGTMVKICDNKYAMSRYLAYHRRIMDIEYPIVS